MPTSDSPILRQSVRWGEEYVSRGLNAKFAGIIKPGVYRGFRLRPGGGMSVLVDHDPDYPRSVAVVERDGYSLGGYGRPRHGEHSRQGDVVCLH